MRDAQDWEQEIGIFYYLTDFDGIGGRIKEEPEDFVVEEVHPELGTAEVRLLRGEKAPRDPEGNGDFLWVVLEKRDWATIDAVNRIASLLRISRKYVGFAGTKDKYAVTAQWISLRSVKWRDLRELDLKDMSFHTPVYRKHRLRLGQLEGNYFTIRIRGARSPIPRVDRFPNYFGYQRFGSYRFVSHLVGKAIVRGDWEQAAFEYLTRTSPWEPQRTREARMRLRDDWGNFREALSYYPRRLRQEFTLLRALARGKSFESAFRQLHPRLLSLFLHAYQSYLFNVILSLRLEEGVEPRQGDILLHGVPTALIPGYSARFAGGVQGEIERSVLEDEGVSLDAFRRFRKMSAQGGRRKIIQRAEHLSVRGDTLRFFLEKGSYATLLLREIIKPASPEGFAFTPHRARD